MKIDVCFKKMAHFAGLELPYYATSLSAGMDIHAAVDGDIVLSPFKRALIPTGLQVAIPDGYEIQVRPRSGLAYKNGVTVLNTPGTIDADYRGEIKILLVNLGDDFFVIHRGDRIAQLVLQPVYQACLKEVETLDETERGQGGFGSTGSCSVEKE